MRSLRLLPVLVATVLLPGCSTDGSGSTDTSDTATGQSSTEESAPAPVRVVFDDGGGRIFVMNLDGSDVQPVLPTAPADDPYANYGTDAVLSPDGSAVAYTSGGRSIDVVDLASHESKTVVEGGYQPAFSPDGSMLAFTDGSSISVANIDGSDARVVAREESASQVTFSPDGTRVVFNASGYLVEAPVSGGESTVLLRDRFWNADPAFSPDGATLVFSSNRGGNNGSEIYSMPTTGGDITPLTVTYAVHPEFTPDGTRIFYTRAVTPTGEPVTDVAGQSRPQVAAMNPDGTDQQRVTPPGVVAQDPSVGGTTR